MISNYHEKCYDEKKDMGSCMRWWKGQWWWTLSLSSDLNGDYIREAVRAWTVEKDPASTILLTRGIYCALGIVKVKDKIHCLHRACILAGHTRNKHVKNEHMMGYKQWQLLWRNITQKVKGSEEGAIFVWESGSPLWANGSWTGGLDWNEVESYVSIGEKSFTSQGNRNLEIFKELQEDGRAG